MNADTKRFLQSQLMWLGISFAISIAISLVLPYPWSLMVMIAVFLGMNYFIRKRQIRKMGMTGTSFFGGSGPMFGQRTLDYYCMSCGTKHNQRACPKCGSTMKRVGF